ncbi:YkgJ family cysteine cluster protein [Cyanobium sp. WAJ14-Wanaka]|uniref:YkgJ family cysteine cluster protein n=1 Tax=Cyanobium sp. WAJ14-Wanaka TaxID=2823725 RepID=UPI0020CD3D20|nr:YkgJ family cysteine cluster protein [Cyanobium sp. WAJ14-Wanaka]MCP9774414.1 YkgJ family cysteine cluster protein [Cyanobium sp. WAJ14-Wanaka]
MACYSERWQCISQCGACCRLDPSQRPEALDALEPGQRELYLSMVGADGWCIHYNSGARSCGIYEQRPDFCRVSNLVNLFGAPDQTSNGNDLAIACCKQQIRSEYGGRGRVMKRFLQAIRRHP